MFGFGKNKSLDSSTTEKGLFGRLKAGLSKTRGGLTQSIANLVVGRKQINDDLLEPWLLDLKKARWQDGYLRTLFSAAALLKSGVTSTIDMTSVGESADTAAEFLRDQIKAYEKAGLRVALAPGATYRSFLISGKDEDKPF